MKEKLQYVLKVSRPRFWLYLAGPYLVGYVFSVGSREDFHTIFFFATFLYFLLPANFLIYAINDYFDKDTDALNSKKRNKESAFIPEMRRIMLFFVIASLALTLVVLIIQPNFIARLWLLAFVTLGVFYSTPPVRFKSKPVLDFSSNILYALPAFTAYSAIAGNIPPLQIVLASYLWTSAMHLFSAIPDIAPDKKAGLTTTAVVLGKKRSLVLVFILWTSFWILLIGFDVWFVLKLAATIYPAIPLYLILNPKSDINKIYWLFPRITGTGGLILFWSVFIHFVCK